MTASAQAGTSTGAAISDYLSHLNVERGLSDNTIASYRRDLKRYAAYLDRIGRTSIAAVTEAEVAGFLADLRTGDDEHRPLGPASAARALIATRGLHKFCVKEGIVGQDVAATVKPPRPPQRLPKALPAEDIERILQAADTGGNALMLRNRALLEILYGTGARISEAIGLDIDDLDLAERAVLLRGKGDKQRIVPVGSFAIEAVRNYLTAGRPALVSSGRAGPALFLNARGGRLSRQSAWAILVAAAERAGIDSDVTPHTLRHSYATHLLDGGADVRVVQELLGHASVTTTQIYTKVTVERLREVYAGAHPRAR